MRFLPLPCEATIIINPPPLSPAVQTLLCAIALSLHGAVTATPSTAVTATLSTSASPVAPATPSPSPKPCQFSGFATISGTVVVSGTMYYAFIPLGVCDAGGWGTPQKGTFDISITNPLGCELSVVPTSGNYCSPPVGQFYGTVYQIPGSSPVMNTRRTSIELTSQPCDKSTCCASLSSVDNSALCIIGYTITFKPATTLAEAAAIVKWFLTQSYAIPVVAVGGAVLLFLAVMRLCANDTCQCLRRLLCCKHEEEEACCSCFTCCFGKSSLTVRSTTVRDVNSDSSEQPLCAAGGCYNKAASACPNSRCRSCCIAEGKMTCARHSGTVV